MNFFPFSRSPKKGAVRKPSRKSGGRQKSELDLELERVRRDKEEAHRKAAEIQARIDDIPRQVKRREEKDLQRIRDRAKRTKTMGFDRTPQKVRSVVDGARMTRGQKRAVMNRFLLLCALFVGMLYCLWKAVR
jgi:hypothetical protein